MTVGDPLKDVENRVYYSIGPEVRERQADPKDGDKPWTRAVAMCRSDDVAKKIVDLLNADAEYGARPRPLLLTPDQAPKLSLTVDAPPETPPAECVDVAARDYLTELYQALLKISTSGEPPKPPWRTTCRRSSNCQQRDGHDGECRLEYP